MKQISAVLNAVNIGCETSDAVAAVTGLSVATASAYLSALCEDGVIRRVRHDWVRFNRSGRASAQYAPRVAG